MDLSRFPDVSMMWNESVSLCERRNAARNVANYAAANHCAQTSRALLAQLELVSTSTRNAEFGEIARGWHQMGQSWAAARHPELATPVPSIRYIPCRL